MAVLKQDELRLLFWETTAGCNLECIHCRRLEVSKQLMKDDLNTAEALEFVRALASFAKPILVLSGGEPLFRPDIFEIARCAHERNLPVALATNGTLFDDAMARKIVDSGIRRVAISIDGADEITHDKFRCQSGALAAALRGFQLLKQLGMSMQINCTITRHNIHQLEQLYALACELGTDALHLFMLVPVGCGLQIAQSNMLPAYEYERVLNWIYDKTLLRQMHLKATCAPHYFRVMRQRAAAEGKRHEPPAHHGMAALTKGCLAGSEICFVSHSGEVFPCGYLPLSAGNVKKEGIRNIWEKSALFTRLRDPDQLEGKCGVCEFKRICFGCRARAFYETRGNYMAEEPYCTYQPQRMRQPDVAAVHTLQSVDIVAARVKGSSDRKGSPRSPRPRNRGVRGRPPAATKKKT